MKLTGKIEKLMQEVIPALMSQKKDKVYELEIKVKREKRKLNQNQTSVIATIDSKHKIAEHYEN